MRGQAPLKAMISCNNMPTTKCNQWLAGLVLLQSLLLATAAGIEADVVNKEAAFQGHCGHTSPCEQLCYEIHDGMYECDCIEGYELNKNGYSCQVINSTNGSDGHGKSDEDVLYQKGASFSAKLANDNERDNKLASVYGTEGAMVRPADERLDMDTYDYNDESSLAAQEQKVNSNDYYISAESISFNADEQRQHEQEHEFQAVTTAASISSTASHSSTVLPSTMAKKKAIDLDVSVDVDDYYGYKGDMSIYDDVSNNQLDLRRNSETYTYQEKSSNKETLSNAHIRAEAQAAALQQQQLQQQQQQQHKSKQINISDDGKPLAKVNEKYENVASSNTNSSFPQCNLECGADGTCNLEQGIARCMCPFGKTGAGCNEDIEVHVPRFSKHSWLAFAALHGAYKHVQLRVEFRPESFDGIILLSGERDDLTGDFMALLLNKGFVEFWFDCGSGVGNVRSRETIMLNEWNSVIIYRHRWDAWLVLNHGTKVQGRSNGLFSRITFREPVFLGGVGNITGLGKRLPLAEGFAGCIRRFVANEHDYKFTEHPLGDVIKGFDIQDCATDKCVRYPCQHGGKCLASDQGAVCLCPIGFVGDLCEIRMDLQVPSFNGSSFLRYAPLGDSALIWLELKVILKPQQSDGLILYSGPEQRGDFIALYLHNGFVEFAFDLGSGPAVVRSEYALGIGQWHVIKISRTARLAVLKIDEHQEVMTISTNGFWHLSLEHNLFVGGVNHVDKLPLDLKSKPFFVGCIQRIDINGHSLGIVSEALGGSNIGNCPHACVARPCGPLAECMPQMENYECRCSIHNERCNKAAEVPPKDLTSPHKALNSGKVPDDSSSSSSSSSSSKSGRGGKLLEAKHNRMSMGAEAKKMWAHKKRTAKHRNLHRPMPASSTHTPARASSSTRTTTTAATTKATTHHTTPTTTTAWRNDEGIDDDIIFRFVHDNTDVEKQENRESGEQGNANSKVSLHYGKKAASHLSQKSKPSQHSHHQHHKHRISKDEHHQKPNAFTHKLSRLPTHYESFQTNPDSDILTFDDTNDWVASMREQEYADAMARRQEANRNAHVDLDDTDSFVFDESLFDASDGTEEYQRKQLAQDMKRIMSNTHEQEHKATPAHQQPPNKAENDPDYSYNDDAVHVGNFQNGNEHDDGQEDELLTPMFDSQPTRLPTLSARPAAAISTPQTHTDWSLLKKFDLSAEHQSQVGVRKNFGACFAGADSYFHYNDAETMSQIISNNIDLNLRIKTHSEDGVILWTGRQSTTDQNDDYLSLGIEQGYLHFRYDLGAGEVDIRFNGTKVSDGLWHRVRAIRNSQEGYLEVDGRKTSTLRAPGKLRQLNTDTGLYVGGMPDVAYFTHQQYHSGIVGCISEIALAGVGIHTMKLNFDPNTLGTSHNVETGLL